MSQAENLLDSLTVDDVTPYTAEPQTEGYIVIGRDRFITVPESLKRIAVQDDHNIETVTFECPRYWDENDLSEMQIFINYRRPDGVTGSYIAKNVKPQGDLIHFDWTIESHVTQFKGQLDFLVCTKETDEEGMEKRHWNTELNRDMYISEGLEVEGEIVSQNPAIITDLLTRMDEVERIAVKEEVLEQHVANTLAAVGRAEVAVATATDKAEDMTALFDKFERNLPGNRFNGKSTVGYIKADGTGVLGDQTMSYTDPIPVTDGEVITLQATMFVPSTLEAIDREIARITHVTAYDNRMTILPSLGSDTSSTSYVVPGGVSYIRISSDVFYYADPNNFEYEPSYLYGDIAIVASETVIPYEEYFNPTYGELKPENVMSTTSQLGNAIKGCASGEIVKINDISPVEHNMAVKVSGKNLIPFPYANTTVTRDGITFTVNDDRSVTVDGTATAATTFVIANATSGINFEHGVTYTLSGKGGNISVAMAYKIADGSYKYQTSGGSVTWDESYTFIHIYYSIPSGSTHDGLILPAPQFERGKVATEYVPYVKTEDMHVITCGKNMTPYPYTEDGVRRAGVTYTATEDGVIHANGTSTGSYMNVVSTDEKILYLHKGVTYRFSCTPTGGEGSKYYAYVKDASKTNHFDYGNGVTFTPVVSGYGAITLVVSTGTVATDLLFKPQLEIGTSSGEFEKGGAVVKYSADENGEFTVRSISPMTMIFADAPGAIVECEYNVDMNKVLDGIKVPGGEPATPSKDMNNLYSNALKGTASGEAIAITDASPLEHEMGVKVRNKNLIPFPYERPAGTSVTKSGVTLTTNADGSITLNGTATANIFHSLVTPNLELQDGNYTLSGGYRDTNGNRVAVCIRNPDNTIMATSESTSANYKTQTAGNIMKEAYLYIYNGSTVDNITIYPQLEEGTTATAYTPHIPDFSTVKVKRYGKNLFKGTTRKEHHGITFEPLDDGTYHVYGTNDGTANSYLDHYIDLPIGKYTGSGCPNGGSTTTYRVQFYNQTTTKGPVDYGNGTEFETTATQRITVQMLVYTGQTVDLIFKPMVEAGTGDKVYEPYIEPIEYPVSADGTVNGIVPNQPTTTLMTDTAGAVIDCTYNRDLTKAFTELENKINTLLAATASV